MMYKKSYILTILLPGVLLLFGIPAYAEPMQSMQGMDWSATAQSTMSIYQFTSSTIAASLLSIGIAFMGGACLKFKYHRDNPAQTPLSQPITLFVVASVMLLFALFIMVSQKYVYTTNEHTGSSISEMFQPKNPQQTVKVNPVKPLEVANSEEKISLDSPYM